MTYFICLRKKRLYGILFLIGLVLLLLLGCLRLWAERSAGRPVSAAALPEVQVLVLDAGHGGEDGGAVADDGTMESGLNLAIVQKLDLLCGFFGVPAVLTREGDCSLADPGIETLRGRKTSDLKNRVKRINGIPNACLISIHQNHFPESRYSGAQVFFAPTEGSEALGERMQTVLREAADPENTREAKAIQESIYLMNHIECKGVLVECGFLSNPREAALLCSGAYQTKLAAAILAAYLADMKEEHRDTP